MRKSHTAAKITRKRCTSRRRSRVKRQRLRWQMTSTTWNAEGWGTAWGTGDDSALPPTPVDSHPLPWGSWGDGADTWGPAEPGAWGTDPVEADVDAQAGTHSGEGVADDDWASAGGGWGNTEAEGSSWVYIARGEIPPWKK
ncbi:hypothetical protein C8R47DRAFT_1230726 [Mycena vitilis]|nr:hypothetical protein C8R47DRAFT_1230726 [Mycena vitilis]